MSFSLIKDRLDVLNDVGDCPFSCDVIRSDVEEDDVRIPVVVEIGDGVCKPVGSLTAMSLVVSVKTPRTPGPMRRNIVCVASML